MATSVAGCSEIQGDSGYAPFSAETPCFTVFYPGLFCGDRFAEDWIRSQQTFVLFPDFVSANCAGAQPEGGLIGPGAKLPSTRNGL